MLKRTLTGLCILILVVGFVALRFVHIAFFDAFVFALSLIATYEVIKCITSDENKKQLIKFLPYVYVLVTFGLYMLSSFNVITTNMAFMLEIFLIISIFAISFIFNLFYLKNMQKNGENVDKSQLISLSLNTMIAVLYPGFILSFLYKLNSFGLNLGLIAIVMVFAVSMVTDVFAYLTGTLTRGKGPRLCPSISPKKGVYGMIGGLFFGIVAGICGYFTFVHAGIVDSILLNITTFKAIIMFLLIGLFGSIFTQIGDLVASSVKRNHNIKDYGNLFPGHGGVMDRVDGLMFNSISVYIIISLFII